MIPLGILAAAGGAVASVDSYDLLATEILTSSQSSVTFASLGTYAADYQHLQLRVVARTLRSSTGDALLIQFNNDTGSNYARHLLSGNGSSASSEASASRSNIELFRLSGANDSTSSFGAILSDILDPFITSKNTTLRSLGGSTGDPQISLGSGAWFNTASINTIKCFAFGGNFVAGSRFSLYGIRKAA